MDDLHIALIEFSPSEAADISGVPQQTQRDWRRRGFIPAQKGTSRYTGFDLAELWGLRLLSEGHVPLAEAAKVARPFLGAGLMGHALRKEAAYTGNAAAAALQANMEGLRREAFHRSRRTRALVPDRFLIVFPDGQHEFYGSVDRALNIAENPSQGVIRVLDQHALASAFLERTGPLVEVSAL